jgi:CO dehydrogenase maturation factor
LLERPNSGPVLCIDADPNSCLALALGVEPGVTVAEIRELARAKPAGADGPDRVHAFEYGLQQAITEAGKFDLVTMGRPEGPSCYCAINNILRRILDELSSKYRFVVIDNEAGMEHLSRRTTRDVQHLLIVSDPTQRGLIAAQRIAAMRKELDIHIEKTHLIVNRLEGKLPADLDAFVGKIEVPLLGLIPADASLTAFEYSGRPLVELGDKSPVYQAVAKMMDQII